MDEAPVRRENKKEGETSFNPKVNLLIIVDQSKILSTASMETKKLNILLILRAYPCDAALTG